MKYLLLSLALLATIPVFSQNINLELRSTMEFPGQALANICGYARNGREYALVAASKGMVVVDVTDPDHPVSIVQVPAPLSTPNEIKVYKNNAYVTSDNGKGLQIVNLNDLPNSDLSAHYFLGAGQMEAPGDSMYSVHTLHIDTTKGYLYLYGGNLYNGGAKVFDLNNDPYNPTYAGKFNALGYIHDGYVENDTLYACHIGSNILSIVDMSDKPSPVVLGTVPTPGGLTHNSWLTEDRRHVLTTGESFSAYLTSFDIADPQDIRELDRIAPNDSVHAACHNTHVYHDWAVTSWYTDGVYITDAHRPENLVYTGWYDTWPGNGTFFAGCWGVYPFFPSGTIVASNNPTFSTDTIPGKMFVLTPTYVRACYLEGIVTNGCNGKPMHGATIEVNSDDPWINTKSNNQGIFKTGQAEAGNFKVTISKPGYFSQTLDVAFINGEVTELNVTLVPDNVVDIKGVVFADNSQAPIANVSVQLVGPDSTYTLHTDVNGQFNLDCRLSGDYEITTAGWGYLNNTFVLDEQSAGSGNLISIYLQAGYYDSFDQDLGWTTNATATSGLWERGDPIGTKYFQDEYCNPEFDSDFDLDETCYMTGNGGGSAGLDDVDSGAVILTSPYTKLAAYPDPVLSFDYWFYNEHISDPVNDQFEAWVSNGMQNVVVFSENKSQANWRSSGDIRLKDYITLTDDVRIHFIATDTAPNHLVEAAVDIVSITPNPVLGTPDLDASASLQITPNPSASSFSIRYEWPNAQNVLLEVRNLLGQMVWAQQPGDGSGSVVCGDNWPAGVYMATLRSNERQSVPLRLVKQ